ncbi:MAG: hypothetical protein CR964_00830 [Rhodobacterales bacterium]|nr:MAG: hypothetical protein CR964_00830 [Rhodobacterales bacterium]
MAAFETTRPMTVDGLSFGGRLSEMLSNLFGMVAAWNDARQTRAALSRLTDHQLEDIGLTRADLNTLH